MDSKTKIVVLHTRELIYTAVFALLCILSDRVAVICLVPDIQTRSKQLTNSIHPVLTHPPSR